MRTRLLVGLIALAAAAVLGYRVAQLASGGVSPGYQVGLVHDGSGFERADYLREAYDAVLDEEGIPHAWVPARDLLLLGAPDAARRYRALIFPDGLAQQLPVEIAERTRQYLEAGGSIAVVFDPGTRDPSGSYRPGGLLARLVGVEYLQYETLGDQAYREGSVRFADPAAARFWHIPPGKLFQGQVVGGYAYGGLTYPIAAAETRSPEVQVFASDGNVPVLALRPVGQGKAIWVNLPLGFLKASSDDLPLRLVLRTFLFDVVGLPHLVASPDGVGGLEINWHIDSRIELEGVPAMLEFGLVRPDLKQDFEITAGPDRDRPGDDLGFDACGRGKELVRRLLPYGAIGSHGGWAHNWFSEALINGELAPAEIERYVRQNDDCLEQITGTPVRSYAAPNGIHPQPVMTEVLQKLGIVGYYYTGDTGSPPNRTFFNRHMISGETWAFPVMPNGRFASIGEMAKAGLSADQVEDWLNGTLEYAVAERSPRLVYSHPYDLLDPSYRSAFARFLDLAEQRQREGTLKVETMEYFTRFFDRFLKTRYRFTPEDGALAVTLENAEGLEGIAFAVPADWLPAEVPLPPSVEPAPGGGNYRVFRVRTNEPRLQLRLPRARP